MDLYLYLGVLMFLLGEVLGQLIDERVCIGTNGRMSVPSNRDHHYRNLKDRFTNCTYVDGNLELTWLEDNNLDLSFLQYIREVTGYVLISHVDIKRIVLPRLQIIRGRTLFKMGPRNEQFALIITLNKMYSVELPALRDILTGSVGIINNYNLCHIKSIEWKEIMSDPKARYNYVYNFTSNERECTPCHKACVRGCWGDGYENCQKFSKTTCSPQCAEGRCFGPNPRECCHLFCAGGCTGPTQSDCIACKNFYDDGVCTNDCPPMQIYNPTTYSWEENPNGKYAYGATCVKKCPEHLLKDNGACVRSCPSNKKAQDGECVLCDGPCPKTCVGDKTVHSGNIDSFRGCTVIEGYLSILENSFKGFQDVFANYSWGERYPEMHPDRLEVFSTLKELTGYLNIQAYHEKFKNLSYFRNLEIIHGRILHEFSSSLYIVKTSLESLELQSLKKINMGTVAILENKHLCFAKEINWEEIRKSHEHSLMLSNNSDPKMCKAKGLICDEQCSSDGCWGPGPDQCLSCAHFKLDNRCLQNCTVEPGIYRADNKKCKPCHHQCGSDCHGPGPEHCTTCRNFKDGPFCVEKCPTNKYEENGICMPCHSTCVDGCTGPKNTVGPGGCTSCELAIMNENATVDECLHQNDSCPDGYYFEWVGPQVQEESSLRSLTGKAICRKCHPRCKKCTGYGFHELICQECTNFKKGEQCEDECTMDHYPDIATHVCMACDLECRGCSGPGPENCNICQNFKLYDDGWIDPNNTFKCVAACPPDFPHRIFPENSDSYCSDKPPATFALIAAKSPTYVVIIAICIIGGIITIITLVSVMVYCQRKEKIKENAIKMTMAMALNNIDDNEPLRPSNAPPNIAHLRIIKETEIRKGNTLGYGAFGVVYKGVWAVDGETSSKIPVAIKVLKNDTTTNNSKEFLSEAYIMASVDHPNLLKLLAVCMTSQMMLITQLMPLGCLLDFVRKNHDKIGSKTMLNWCTQIARGMAYLEEKRLVHRDLAARNVLVQKPSCVKITDFGLAKLLDINEEEYKAAGGKMPIKWLALECIQHRIFTHKSDVWAFGVTVWELFTFGDRPYDNVPARDVPELLEKGKRLPQPSIATIDVYMIMVKCWMLDAESRPCFKELEDDFCKMSLDPGRYLIIPGDRFMRLQGGMSTPLSDRDMVKSLVSENIDISENDDYMHQPKSRVPFHGTGMTSLSGVMSATPTPDKYWHSSQPMTSDGSGMYPNSQNQFNHKLSRLNQDMHRRFDPNLQSIQNDLSSISYCRDSLKFRQRDNGSDEHDSSDKFQHAQVGNLKLELPVDDDDYLMPSPQLNQGPSAYLDLKNTTDHLSNPNLLQNYSELFQNNIDNPEYLMGSENAPEQTVGLPDVSDFVVPPSPGIVDPRLPQLQKTSEEESDHECYNDFDRLRRELQPLQQNQDLPGGAIV
ncbi:epidermal growth factor receptor isoform X2 [Anthonomus grandis grandis]|uniref:epidermal growth factor receptor isoform X2 n=1 Tax=Anthonomus grandis grandis TaxID=2921223 RepID=UPI0021661B9B|nr:epidermal growth factor receptor isoform X2 [Anthonomus grandis grandis]